MSIVPDEKPTNSVPVRAGHPLRRADRITLDQAADDLGAAGEGYAVHGLVSSRKLYILSYTIARMSMSSYT